MIREMNENDYKNWQPLSVDEVVKLFSGLNVQWWIAGGYAIELFIGKSIRSHEDIDVLIKRDDQLIVQEYLSSWELYQATYPGLKLWEKEEFLLGRYRDIWCRHDSNSSWKFQLILFDTDNDEWIFKRDPSIKGSLKDMGQLSKNGINYISPEIQLLYKAKPETLEKDLIDFDKTIPLLNNKAYNWLLQCLKKRFPEGHNWIKTLEMGNTILLI